MSRGLRKGTRDIMAHADYHCCAVCDSKLEYSDHATTKKQICPVCAIGLYKLTGSEIATGEALVDWVRSTPSETVRRVLADLGFTRCYYANEVDEAVAEALGQDAFDPRTRYLLSPAPRPHEQPGRAGGDSSGAAWWELEAWMLRHPEATPPVPPSEAVRQLEAAQGDSEYRHIQADRLLLGVLLYLGQRDVVEAYTAARRRVGFYFA